MKKIVLALCMSILSLNAMDPNQEEDLVENVGQIVEEPEDVPNNNSYRANQKQDAPDFKGKFVERQIENMIFSQNIENIMLREKFAEYSENNKMKRHLAQGFFQALESAPQVATQVAVQAVASELTQLGIEKVKELFDADLRETKEFVAIMSKLKQTTEKFQILIDSMNTAHKQNLELLKRNPEDATIKEMVQKTEAEMLIKKKKLLQRHNQLVSLYTNKLVNLACQDTEKNQQTIITPQRVALGGVATAAIVAGFTYLRK